MTLTIALIMNAVLVAGLVAALYTVMRIPFRLPNPKHMPVVSIAPSDEHELTRAA